MKTLFSQRMSQFFAVLFVMMLVSFSTTAKVAIYFDALAIDAGETSKASLVLDNDKDIVGVQYTITLPAGLSITDKAVNSERIVKRSHTINVSQLDANQNVWVITLSNTSGKAITGNSGAIATITFSADDTFAGGEIVAVEDEVVLTSSEIDAQGNAVQVETETPSTLINKLVASLETDTPALSFTAASNNANINVGLSNTKPVQALSFKVVLPEGISPKMDGNDIEFDYCDRLPQSFEIGSNYLAESRTIIFAVTSAEGETIPVGDGNLFYFAVTADVKTLAENSTISLSEGVASDANASRADVTGIEIEVTNAQIALDKEAEAARVAANLAAKEADAKTIEALQAEMSEAITDNDKYLSEEDKAKVNDFLGDGYASQIEEALKAVAEAGNYESPIDEEAMRAIIDDVKEAIAANKAKEEERVKTNTIAYEADLKAADDLISEFDSAFDEFSEEDLNEQAYLDLKAKIDALKSLAEDALKAVEEEGEYVSVIDAESLSAEILTVKETIAKLTSIASVNAAIEKGVAVFTLQGIRVKSVSKGFYIINNKKVLVR